VEGGLQQGLQPGGRGVRGVEQVEHLGAGRVELAHWGVGVGRVQDRCMYKWNVLLNVWPALAGGQPCHFRDTYYTKSAPEMMMIPPQVIPEATTLSTYEGDKRNMSFTDVR